MNSLCKIRVIIFDFDGVLIESNDEKTDAFKELFSLYPEYERAMLDYHHRWFSKSRMDKFRHFVYEMMARPGDENSVEDMADKFSSLIVRRVITSPEVPGASEFLTEFSQWIPLYISSVTPQDELRKIVRRRGFDPYFKAIYGYPPISKKEAIEAVLLKEDALPQEVMFIGDSVSDYHVANEAGVRFTGRESGLSFGEHNIHLYKDLFEIADVIRLQIGVKHSETKG